ncbi:MAG TPA: PilZ domain-containing protein [Vicinamibacterales bacterium]|nr:PilZ domain-containing protein [Vicinamibacterales bacterium]
MRRGMGDRRLRPRFDVVGQLAGTLDASVSMGLRDVGRGGAQVESFVQLPAGSLHRATFNCDGIEAAVQVCVRHVKPLLSSTGEQRYLIGLEFVSPSPAVLELIERWLMLHGGEGALGAGEPN